MMKKIFTVAFVIFCGTAFGQQYINVMFYNLYRFPVQPPANREHILKDILNTYHPDLLMNCELVDEEGADRILNTSLNHGGISKYARAAFVFTQSGAADDPLHQIVFYNKEKLILLQQQVYPTKVRDINHYTFLLNTIGDSVYLDAFVTHLKSSEGPANRQLRSEMIDTFVKKLETVPASHYVLLAGDFNFYSSYNETAYHKILDTTNPIVMVDPIHMPGKWNNNDSFKAIHTQATRLSAAGFGEGGASGGMDDRFDFIMMSKSLEQPGNLSYVEGSYKAYGNNGNCFDNRIDAYDCEGPYPLSLRQNLYNMSDHTPVVLQLKTNREFLVDVDEVSPSKELILLNGNIVKDFLNLRWDNKNSFDSNLFCMYNNLGWKTPVILTKTGNGLQIDFRHLKAGMYYLRYRNKEQIVFRILKL
jgi:hypothetical protein